MNDAKRAPGKAPVGSIDGKARFLRPCDILNKRFVLQYTMGMDIMLWDKCNVHGNQLCEYVSKLNRQNKKIRLKNAYFLAMYWKNTEDFRKLRMLTYHHP